MKNFQGVNNNNNNNDNKWHASLLWDFNIQTDHLIPARRPDLIIINKKKKKKKICKIVDFAVPADHRLNLKKIEKKDKYLDLARELKKLWNMKVTIVPIVIGALGTITKGLLKGLEDLEIGGRVETIQTTALIRTARILRRVLETWGDLLFSEKPSANTDVKNSKGVNNNKTKNKKGKQKKKRNKTEQKKTKKTKKTKTKNTPSPLKNKKQKAKRKRSHLP